MPSNATLHVVGPIEEDPDPHSTKQWLCEIITTAIAKNSGKLTAASFGITRRTLNEWQHASDGSEAQTATLGKVVNSQGAIYFSHEERTLLRQAWLRLTLDATRRLREPCAASLALLGHLVSTYPENLWREIPLRFA